jgi:hypothetical protein
VPKTPHTGARQHTARPEGFEPPTLGLEVRPEDVFVVSQRLSLGASCLLRVTFWGPQGCWRFPSFFALACPTRVQRVPKGSSDLGSVQADHEARRSRSGRCTMYVTGSRVLRSGALAGAHQCRCRRSRRRSFAPLSPALTRKQQRDDSHDRPDHGTSTSLTFQPPVVCSSPSVTLKSLRVRPPSSMRVCSTSTMSAPFGAESSTWTASTSPMMGGRDRARARRSCRPSRLSTHASSRDAAGRGARLPPRPDGWWSSPALGPSSTRP